jgi:hypothetical protein
LNLRPQANLATISASPAHSSLIRKVRKSSRLGTLVDRYHKAYFFFTAIIMNVADMNMVVMKKQK